MLTHAARFLRGVFNRFDDVLIAGAAAEIAFQSVANLFARWIRIAIEDLRSRS